jgi:glucose-6-phosphate isomerase
VQTTYCPEINQAQVMSAGLSLDLEYQGIELNEWKSLFGMAQQIDIVGQINNMFSGEVINISEGRPVLHTALRNRLESPVYLSGVDIMPEIISVWRRMQLLSEDWDDVTDLIHIGIGGSVFGPELVVRALENIPGINSREMRIHFAANIDAEELSCIFKQAIPTSTRVIIVSKTFSTVETLMNAKAVMGWLSSNGCSDEHIKAAIIAVTANTVRASDFGVLKENIYPFWDWVGGRFSVWSAVGMCIALQYGFDVFMSLLDGAHTIDEDFRSTPIEQNLPILMALALIHQQKKHQIEAYALIPYANALSLLPLWLQQLEMESHGKRVGPYGAEIPLSSPVVFGSVGTNAQHSYFQLLHQGSQIIPVDFIAVIEPMSDLPEAENHHRVLMANCLAQAQALALGKSSDIPNEVYLGGRPSNLILLPKLDAYHLGALLALYESRAVALGILWGINSFDQPGVELGKQLAIPIDQALKQDGSMEPGLVDPITRQRIQYLKSMALRP